MRGSIDMRSQERAKSLRGRQTEAESQLWYHLRAKRFLGLKFVRQKPLGPYIVDFFCDAAWLVIEADGGQHNDKKLAHDQRRDAWLKAQGYTVLRFWNDEVLQQTEAVLEKIRAVVAALPSPPTPLPPEAGEGSKASL